jgi:S1-C subfamily serine protease
MRAGLWIGLFFIAWPLAGSAEMMRVQFGTGFFVNREYVITNAHVVTGCTEVYIKGAVPEQKATVKVTDTTNDLALIATQDSPKQFAPLRFNIEDLKVNDKVLLMGYPGEAGVRGEYTVATGQILNMHEIMGSEGRFYITDVAEHGNSGGPVFDTSGNVIGVVVGKTTLFMVNSVTKEKSNEQHVSVVISLATLKQFLFDHGIFTEWLGSSLLYADSYIEDNAKSYIVNVQCRQSLVAGTRDGQQGTAQGTSYGR